MLFIFNIYDIEPGDYINFNSNKYQYNGLIRVMEYEVDKINEKVKITIGNSIFREKALEIRKGLTDLVELNIYCCSAKDDIINTAKLNRAFKNTYDYSSYINTCKSTLTNCLAEIQNRGYTIYVSSNDLAKLFRESGFYEKVNNNYIIADKCKKSFYAEFDEQAGYSRVFLTEFGKEALFKLLTLIDALD